jgi:hypothetical protein
MLNKFGITFAITGEGCAPMWALIAKALFKTAGGG